jgi:hypothetical protein
MSEVMLDLETYSVNSNAIIMTIGAIKFTRTKNIYSLEECDTFYRRITFESSQALGLHSNPDTVQWWSEQSEEARYEIETPIDRIPIQQALQEFTIWLQYPRKIWSHGTIFDCIILQNSYQACNMPVPWNFYDVRDTRTLFDLGKVKIKDIPSNGSHHALHDAYRQIIGVKQALKNLNLL